MKKMKKIICVAVVLLILAAVPGYAFAAENTTAWDDVDWKTFDWKLLYDDPLRISINTWLENDAEYPNYFAFHVQMRLAQVEYMSESYGWGILMHFAEEPEEFLIALAKESRQTQEIILAPLCSPVQLDIDGEPMVQLAENIKLDGKKNPEAVKLLREIASIVEKNFGVSITVPPTGDPIPAAVLGLLCATAGALLLRRKKES